jgi:hypothetical protein
MADRTVPIGNLGESDAPLTYTVPPSFSFTLMGVRASFDGGGAAGAFLPCVQLVSDSGQIMAQTIGSAVAAGGSADVTFAPFLKGTTTASGDGITFDTDPQSGDWLFTETTTPVGGSFGGHLWPGVPSGLPRVGTMFLDSSGFGAALVASNGGPVFLAVDAGLIDLSTNGGSIANEAADFSVDASDQIALANSGAAGISVVDGGVGGLTLQSTGGPVTVSAGGSSSLLTLNAVEVLISPSGGVGGGFVVSLAGATNQMIVFDNSAAEVFRVNNDGTVKMPKLPVTNPGGSGLLWNNGGVLNIT